MRVLVDIDDVLADWWGAFTSELDSYYPHLTFPFIPDPTSWNLYDGLIGIEYLSHVAAIDAVRGSPGFFRNLVPINGGQKALNDMLSAGIDVYICSSPDTNSDTCASEKLQWVKSTFGYGWEHRTILTQDKTLVSGDYLIDDKPYITGVAVPTWEHILFTSPHNLNRGINDGRKRLNSWKDWKEVLYS